MTKHSTKLILEQKVLEVLVKTSTNQVKEMKLRTDGLYNSPITYAPLTLPEILSGHYSKHNPAIYIVEDKRGRRWQLWKEARYIGVPARIMQFYIKGNKVFCELINNRTDCLITAGTRWEDVELEKLENV